VPVPRGGLGSGTGAGRPAAGAGPQERCRGAAKPATPYTKWRWPSLLQVAVIGVPADLGANRRGTDMGPSAIRYAQLARQLEALGHQVHDLGNILIPVPESRQPGDPRRKYFDEIAALWHELADLIEAQCRQGRLPLILGGDHSLSVGSVAGVARAAG